MMRKIVRQKATIETREAITGRMRINEMINKYYFKFGNRIVQTMLRFASRHGGLDEIVETLRLKPVDNTKIHMHDAIFQFITDFGTAQFLTVTDCLERGETAGQSEMPDGNGKKNNQDGASRLSPDNNAATIVDSGSERGGKNLINECRRSGTERRVKKSRRAVVEVITKNRRFGGERRSGIDRRLEDTPAPWSRPCEGQKI